MSQGSVKLGALLIAGGFTVFAVIGLFIEGQLGTFLSIGGGVLMILGANMIRKFSAEGSRARTMGTIALALTWITFLTSRYLTRMANQLDDATLDELKTYIVVSGVNDVLVTLIGFLALVVLARNLERALLVTGLLVSIGGALYTTGSIDRLVDGTLTFQEYSVMVNWTIAGSNVPVALGAALIGIGAAPPRPGDAGPPMTRPDCVQCGTPAASEGPCANCGTVPGSG